MSTSQGSRSSSSVLAVVPARWDSLGAAPAGRWVLSLPLLCCSGPPPTRPNPTLVTQPSFPLCHKHVRSDTTGDDVIWVKVGLCRRERLSRTPAAGYPVVPLALRLRRRHGHPREFWGA